MLRVAQSDGAGNPMYQEPRSVDVAFDGDGTAVLSTGLPNQRFFATAVQSDGNIVAVGEANGDVLVARLTSAGALDTTFAAPTGWMTFSVNAGTDVAQAVSIDSTGRVLVAGRSGSDKNFIARVSALGVLDTGGFASPNGYLEASSAITSNWARIGSVQQLAGGAIIAGGWNRAVGNERDLMIIKITSAGVLDSSFDGDSGTANGIIFSDTGLGGGSQDQMMMDMAIDASGRFVLVGWGYDGTGWNVHLARVLADGRMDTSFGGDGWVTQSFTGSEDDGNSIAIQPDGKIVIAGTAQTSGATSYDIIVARFNDDGSLDSSFDGDGFALINYAGTNDWDLGYDVAVLDSGKIMVVGANYASTHWLMLVRLNANGSVDSSFGTAGFYIDTAYTYYLGMDPIIRAAMGADGTVVVAGASTTQPRISMLRGAGSMSSYQAGVSTWSVGSAGMFGACLRAVSGAGVVGTWTTNASCPASDGAYWNGIPTSTGVGSAKVAASTTSGLASASASVRFGVRTSTSQPPGSYVAPVTFQVVAPNA
jgi:uncharacterized delta-60 repeat protein